MRTYVEEHCGQDALQGVGASVHDARDLPRLPVQVEAQVQPQGVQLCPQRISSAVLTCNPAASLSYQDAAADMCRKTGCSFLSQSSQTK